MTCSTPPPRHPSAVSLEGCDVTGRGQRDTEGGRKRDGFWRLASRLPLRRRLLFSLSLSSSFGLYFSSLSSSSTSFFLILLILLFIFLLLLLLFLFLFLFFIISSSSSFIFFLLSRSLSSFHFLISSHPPSPPLHPFPLGFLRGITFASRLPRSHTKALINLINPLDSLLISVEWLEGPFGGRARGRGEWQGRRRSKYREKR